MHQYKSIFAGSNIQIEPQKPTVEVPPRDRAGWIFSYPSLENSDRSISKHHSISILQLRAAFYRIRTEALLGCTYNFPSSKRKGYHCYQNSLSLYPPYEVFRGPLESTERKRNTTSRPPETKKSTRTMNCHQYAWQTVIPIRRSSANTFLATTNQNASLR